MLAGDPGQLRCLVLTYVPFSLSWINLISGELLSEEEDEGGDEDNVEAYMQEQKSKLEQEKNAIMNDKNLIAEVCKVQISLSYIL